MAKRPGSARDGGASAGDVTVNQDVPLVTMDESRTVLAKSEWWTYPLGVFLVSRAIVFGASFLALKIFYTPGLPMPWRVAPGNLWIDGWVRWDSGWYLRIIAEGYFYNPAAESAVAFFPLYPLLVKGLTPFCGSAVVAGILLSNLCFLAALLVFFSWARQVGLSVNAAQRAVWYLAISPVAFFFSAVYTESLFLLLVVLSVYLAGARHWFLAAVAAALASSTKVVGILMWGVLGLMWMEAHGWRWSRIAVRENWAELGKALRTRWRSFLALQVAPLGMAGYMIYLYAAFGDPLVFLHTQQHWGRADGGVWAAFSEAWSVLSERDWWGSAGDWFPPENQAHFLWDFSLGLLVLATVPFVFRRFGPALGMLALLILLVPLSSGTFVSMARYTVILFPVFAVWGTFGGRVWVDRAISGLFILFLVICTAMFALWRGIV